MVRSQFGNERRFGRGKGRNQAPCRENIPSIKTQAPLPRSAAHNLLETANPNGGPIQRGWRCILSVIGSFERRCEDIEVEPRLRSAGPAISKDELTICRAAFHPGD